MTIYDRICEKPTNEDIIKMIEEFRYYPNLDKNIIPFESDIKDIFNLIVSRSIREFGLKSHMCFSLYETTDRRFEYWVSSYNVPEEKYDGIRPIPSTIYFLNEIEEKITQGLSSTGYYAPPVLVNININNGISRGGHKPFTSISRVGMFKTSMFRNMPKHLLRL